MFPELPEQQSMSSQESRQSPQQVVRFRYKQKRARERQACPIRHSLHNIYLERDCCQVKRLEYLLLYMEYVNIRR
jgi:hypothetical protein